MPTTFRGGAGAGFPAVVADATRDHLDSRESSRAGHSLSCTGVGLAPAVTPTPSSPFGEEPARASSPPSFVLDFARLRFRFDIRSSVPRAMRMPMSAIDSALAAAPASTGSGDSPPSMFSTKSTDQTGG
jgi:hypothetical protein